MSRIALILYHHAFQTDWSVVPMKSRIRILGLLGIVILIVSCSSAQKTVTNISSTPTNDSPSLIGTEWLLTDLAGTPVVPNSKASLSFFGGRPSCGECFVQSLYGRRRNHWHHDQIRPTGLHSHGLRRQRRKQSGRSLPESSRRRDAFRAQRRLTLALCRWV